MTDSIVTHQQILNKKIKKKEALEFELKELLITLNEVFNFTGIILVNIQLIGILWLLTLIIYIIVIQ